MNNKSSIIKSQSKIPDLWSGVQVTQINILSQNAAKLVFFSYPAETTKEELRKNNLFFQNKPNSQNEKMFVTKALTKDYENVRLRTSPKTNPNKPNSKPIQTQNKANFARNKPNQTQFKSKRGLPLPDFWGAKIPTGKLLRIPKPGTNFAAILFNIYLTFSCIRYKCL